jgi:hypothetical protein
VLGPEPFHEGADTGGVATPFATEADREFCHAFERRESRREK